MVADNPETGEHAHGAVASETRQIFENLKLLLESAGSSLDRLIQVHAMIYDRIEYDVLNQVYRQYVPNGPPARTAEAFLIKPQSLQLVRCQQILSSRCPLLHRLRSWAFEG